MTIINANERGKDKCNSYTGNEKKTSYKWAKCLKTNRLQNK